MHQAYKSPFHIVSIHPISVLLRLHFIAIVYLIVKPLGPLVSLASQFNCVKITAILQITMV